jgi:hypothetical protein
MGRSKGLLRVREPSHAPSGGAADSFHEAKAAFRPGGGIKSYQSGREGTKAAALRHTGLKPILA